MKDEPNIPIWKSHVWHGEKCFFVSTIERTYDTFGGLGRGMVTVTWWECDWEKRERGKLIHQGGGGFDHQTICRCVIANGEMPDEENLPMQNQADTPKPEATGRHADKTPCSAFDRWWNENGVKIDPPIMQEAMKEIAAKGWNASLDAFLKNIH
jgi:hypothetical protein